jgi:hypothetical protein
MSNLCTVINLEIINLLYAINKHRGQRRMQNLNEHVYKISVLLSLHNSLFL